VGFEALNVYPKGKQRAHDEHQPTTFAARRIQFTLGGRYWVEGPDSAPEWGIRFTMTLLFPK
jgi:hypothetical protein